MSIVSLCFQLWSLSYTIWVGGFYGLKRWMVKIWRKRWDDIPSYLGLGLGQEFGPNGLEKMVQGKCIDTWGKDLISIWK